jgi:hypothetical protein
MTSPDFTALVGNALYEAAASLPKISPVVREGGSVPAGEEANAPLSSKRTGSRSSWPWWRVRRSLLYYPPAPAGIPTSLAPPGAAPVCMVPATISKEETMPLKFIGIDPDTPGGSCPSVWVDEVTGDMLFQGAEELDADNRNDIAARSPILPHERIVRIPARMRSIVAAALENTA